MNGKGDVYRKVDIKKYEESYLRIFGEKRTGKDLQESGTLVKPSPVGPPGRFNPLLFPPLRHSPPPAGGFPAPAPWGSSPGAPNLRPVI